MEQTEFVLLDCLAVSGDDERQAVWRLLKASDREFVPALSARKGPRDVDLAGAAAAPDGREPATYFTEMSQQPVVLARVGAAVAGFMAFRRNYIVPETGELAHAYVSTLVVDAAFRGRRLGQAMYQFLFARLLAAAADVPVAVATRTWSTNFSHLAILDRLGFACVARLEDGREPGIDTVVYRKLLTG
jgi:ribosomal protein S18 acetylase RimI-like enzyme